MKPLATFTINHIQYLDETGKAIKELPECAHNITFLKQLYRDMVFLRLFDTKAINLHRSGRLGTFPSSLGQEAIYTGIGHAMEPNDIHCPSYRDQGTMMLRGIKPSYIFTYWGGHEKGSSYPSQSKDFPISIPIATHCLHGAGAAYTLKLRQEKHAVLACIGDGGTSEGDFYEALNFAGVHQLPIVFVINNNQWAISVPLRLQTATQTLAQKAIAAEIPGIQVDGNDVVAVYHEVSEALNRARNGQGATLIEAKSFRLCDHTTADDAKRYCPEPELHNAWKQEPIKRLKNYLMQQNAWTEQQDKELLETCQQEIEAATNEYLAMPAPKPLEMFEFLYEKLPLALEEQYRDLENNNG